MTKIYEVEFCTETDSKAFPYKVVYREHFHKLSDAKRFAKEELNSCVNTEHVKIFVSELIPNDEGRFTYNKSHTF